jgi:hypothetical protein
MCARAFCRACKLESQKAGEEKQGRVTRYNRAVGTGRGALLHRPARGPVHPPQWAPGRVRTR